jgi:uncharacterized lipoprotein YajG
MRPIFFSTLKFIYYMKYLPFLIVLLLSACSAPMAVTETTPTPVNNARKGVFKTEKEVSLRRDIYSGNELAKIPANQSVDILGCTQITYPINAVQYWVKYNNLNGYVSARQVQLVGNAPTGCTEMKMMDDKMREVEFALIETVADQRPNADVAFVDNYMNFVVNAYKTQNTPIVQEMKWYNGDVAGKYNVFFKALNCNATKTMKQLHLWIQPMNARNRMVGAPTEFNIMGPLDPGCDFAEAKFMAVNLGRGVTNLKITKAQIDYTDGSRPTLLSNERLVAPLLGCSLQNGACLTKFEAKK